MIGPSHMMGGMRKFRTDDGTSLAQSKTSARKKSKEEEQAEAVKGAAGRFGRAATAKAKKGESGLEHLQRFGREELAKKQKADAEKKKGVEPSKGFIERMMDRFGSKKKDEKMSKNISSGISGFQYRKRGI